MPNTPRSRSTDQRYYGVAEGLVTNVDDPQKLGRVKLKFPWFDPEMESEWCRVRQFYAGNDYGAFFIPEVGDEVLRDRRHLAGDGLVVPVMTISRQTGSLEETPAVITRGFVLDARTEALLKEIPTLLASTLDGASVEERTDPGLIKERIRVELQRFFRKRSGLRPLVLPVVMEI